jgi:chromosome segregation ATPase
MVVEVDCESKDPQRKVLGEFNMNTPPKATNCNKKTSMSWNSGDSEFPPCLDARQPYAVSASTSPLFKKTPPNKSKVTSPLGACDDSDDDNDVTVALDIGDISLQNKEEMYKQASFQVAKYSEADMMKLREEWQIDKDSLAEAMNIADQLMKRALSAENARAAAVKESTQELQVLQNTLKKEKEEAQIAQAPMRALSHTNLMLENEIKALKTAHEQEIEALKNKMGSDKKKNAEILAVSNEKTEILQKEMERQQSQHIEAINEAKAKVYAKVQTKFAQGNKDFLKLKGLNEELTQELTASKEKVTTAESLCRKLHTKISKLEKELTELKASTEEMTSEAKKIKTIVQNKEDIISKTTSKLTTAESEIKILQTLVEEKEVLLNDTSFKLNMAEGKITALEDINASMTLELEATQKERDSQMLAVAKLATSNTTMEAQIVHLSSEVKETKVAHANLHQMNLEMMVMLEKAHDIKG